MFHLGRRTLTAFTALGLGAALTLAADPVAQAAPLQPGTGKFLGTLSPAQVKAELAVQAVPQLSTAIEETAPVCSDVPAGAASPTAGPGVLCTRIAPLPSPRSSILADPAHDDDDDQGSGENGVSSCSVVANSWTEQRLSYCYNLNLTSTFINTKTGAVSTAIFMVVGQATLKPRSGSWKEDGLITMVSGGGDLASAIVKFVADCSSPCSARQENPLLASTGVLMAPGASAASSITYTDSPASGDEDFQVPNYSFFSPPSRVSSTNNPVVWSSLSRIRCDKTMERNTVTGCVVSDVRPVLDLPIDDKYGAAAASYAWAQLYLSNHPGAADSPLTRLDDKATRIANRTNTCEEGSTVPFVRDDDLVPTDSCDEYPFAGTYEGGTNGALCAEIVPLLENGSWNFYEFDHSRPVTKNEPCIRAHVPLQQNTDAGSKYSGFISSQHVIDGEKFTVNLHF
ncbi:hypothetical protein GCM10018780_81390 [Streptomyces lanatus]|nr:hypothetical protein GCM10018780_81390 [Streptomyces lanatus]